MITICKSVAGSARPCDEATYRKVIADECVADICKRVQALKEAGERDAAGELKKSLPVFCYQATFREGKRKNEFAEPNGLVMCDFDGLTDPLHLPRKGEGHNTGIGVLPLTGESEGVMEFCKAHGIVLLHVTPSGHGLRIVFKGDTTKSYVENQHAMADLLQLPLDEACKDLARCSFAVPEDHVLYLDSELFTYNNPGPTPSPLPREGSGHPEQQEQVTTPSHTGEGKGRGLEEAALFKGIPYATIIAEWWKQVGGEPQMGERNVKLHRLATNLRYVCDNDEALLLRVMPSFGLPEAEMRLLIHSACEPRMLWTMPKQLVAVLQRVGVDVASGATSTPGASIREEMMTKEENEYWLARLSDIRLPRGLKESVESVARENRVNALVAVLPCAYTLATGIAYKIWDGQWYRLSGTSVLIGAAASGKSFCRPIVKTWCLPLKETDEAARQVENNYKRERERVGGKGMTKQRPVECIRLLPATASLSTLNERSQNAGRMVWNVPHTKQFLQHLHLLTVEFEFSTVVKSLKQNFSAYLDFLIKSHQDEQVGVDYRNDASANGIRNIHWNQLFAGNMMDFKRLVPDNTVLNGMPLRLLIGFIPDNAYDMNVQTGTLTAHRQEQIDATARLLSQLTGNVDVRPLSERMFKWSERRAAQARETCDKVADTIRRRCGATIGLRAGVLSAVIRNASKWDELRVVVLNDERDMDERAKEYARRLHFTEDDFLLAEFVADYAFEQQYKLFKRPLEKAIQESELPSGGIIFRKEREATTEKFRRLPATFTSKDVSNLLLLTSSAARQQCCRWAKAGRVTYNKSEHTYTKIV